MAAHCCVRVHVTAGVCASFCVRNLRHCAIVFFCRAPKKAFQTPPSPPDNESVFVAWSEEPTYGHEDNLAEPNEGAEDFFGGAEDESDDLPAVVKTPVVQPQLKE